MMVDVGDYVITYINELLSFGETMFSLCLSSEPPESFVARYISRGDLYFIDRLKSIKTERSVTTKLLVAVLLLLL